MQFFLVRNHLLHEITTAKSNIGRGVECSIRINDPTVSRVHAEVQLDETNQSVLLTDLSQNGTFVDGSRVTNAAISRRSEIRFGRVHFLLVILDPESESFDDLWNDASTLAFGDSIALTPTENSVLNLLLEGKSEREAAKQLVVSYHTVHNHVRSIYKKFNVSSRAELMAHFIDNATLDQALPPKR